MRWEKHWRYGLPWRSLGCNYEFPTEKPLHADGIHLKKFAGQDGSGLYLPYGRLWPGFALNTVFYAIVAAGFWQIPLAIRRKRRRGAGRCVRCGYDLKGLLAGSTCPECGA